MSQTASHWHFNFFIPANANRKSFKSSVKPGWYYFGRKMVRERWSFSLFTSSCHLPFTFSSPGHGGFWVGHVVFNFQRAHPVCSFRAHTVCQNLLHVGSTGASDDTVKYGHVSWALWCCGDITVRVPHSTGLWSTWCTGCWPCGPVWAGPTSPSCCLTASSSTASPWWRSAGSASPLVCLHSRPSSVNLSWPGR